MYSVTLERVPDKFIKLLTNIYDRKPIADREYTLWKEFMHENTPVRKVDVPQYTELHPQEAIEEKISLSDRFGMWLSFYPMDQQLYLEIVEHYIVQANLEYNDIVRAESLKWCQARGQRSGRAAYQFSKHWIGSQNLEKLSNKA